MYRSAKIFVGLSALTQVVQKEYHCRVWGVVEAAGGMWRYGNAVSLKLIEPQHLLG